MLSFLFGKRLAADTFILDFDQDCVFYLFSLRTGESDKYFFSEIAGLKRSYCIINNVQYWLSVDDYKYCINLEYVHMFLYNVQTEIWNVKIFIVSISKQVPNSKACASLLKKTDSLKLYTFFFSCFSSFAKIS